MNRLQSELHRLFHLPSASAGPAEGQTRTMVLELARPADWDALAKLWRGVQAELELPAPAIAVSGIDGYQLWFSLAAPVPAAEALAFLESLRQRYLADIASERLGLTVTIDALPPLQAQSGQWSAFVAPDLAPVFAEEPWIDTAPNAEGQADLLARLASIKPAEFRLAQERLGPAAPRAVAATLLPTTGDQDPQRFLITVMNDASVALALRIEAAKALLPFMHKP